MFAGCGPALQDEVALLQRTTQTQLQVVHGPLCDAGD